MQHQRINRYLSIFLIIAICLTHPPSISFAADDSWSDYTERPAVGDGTSQAPYEISTAEELAWFCAQVNSNGNTSACGTLTADIDLSGHTWEAIGRYKSNSSFITYNGTLDGQNHTISGLTINETTDTDYARRGLVGTLGADGVIKNLVISNSNFRANYIAGAICGYAYGRIENCGVASSVSVYASNGSVGGICGVLSSGEILNCNNFGSVSSKYSSGQPVYAAGIVGVSNGSVIDCVNAGKISSGGSGAGICGNGTGSFTRCYNFGNVTAEQNAAGISCSPSPSSAQETIFTQCGNFANLTADSYTSGIAFYADTVSRCFNTGDMSAGKGGTGILLYLGRDPVSSDPLMGKATLTECFNSGDIILTSADSEASPATITGILHSVYGGTGDGNSRNYATVTDCYNIGTLSGGEYTAIGGIAAEFTGTMERCYNTANVATSSAATSRGGICAVVSDAMYYGRDELGDIDTSQNLYSFIHQNYYLSGTAAGAVSGENYLDHRFNQSEQEAAMTSTSATSGALSSLFTSFTAYQADTAGTNGGYPILVNCQLPDIYSILPSDPGGAAGHPSDPTASGEYLYVGDYSVNLLRYENYTNSDGSVEFDRSEGLLKLTNADLSSLDVYMRTDLTVEISGQCSVGDLYYSYAGNNPTALTLAGTLRGSSLSACGYFDIFGNLTICQLSMTQETTNWTNIYVGGTFSLLDHSQLTCLSSQQSGDNENESISETSAEGEDSSEMSEGYAVDAVSIVISDSALTTDGSHLHSSGNEDASTLDILSSTVSCGDVICEITWDGAQALMRIVNSQLDASSVYCGSSYCTVASSSITDLQPSAIYIDSSTISADQIYTESPSSAPVIMLGDRCQITSPEDGQVVSGEYTLYDTAIFYQEIASEDGSRIQLAPKDFYAFTYDHSKTPYANLQDDNHNSDNIVIAYTALAKMSYGTIPVSYFGKTVSDYVTDKKHYEADEYGDKIWIDSDVTYEQFYRDVIGEFTIVDSYDNNNITGFYGVCFRNPYDGSYIISYRGSQNADLQALIDILQGNTTSNDWTTDAAFAIRNELSDQFVDALAFYQEILALADESGNNVLLTGHSLGGALAGYVSITTGAPSIVVDGAVGHIIDVAFWQDYEKVTGFRGVGAASNIANLTDTLGVSLIGDAIQAVHKGSYAMLTFDPISYNKDTSQYPSIANTHQQVSYLEYRNNRFYLGNRTGEYARNTRWSNDIVSFVHNDPHPLSTKPIYDILREGRVQLGTENADTISAPSIPVVDHLPNIQFGGDRTDHIIGYTADDTLSGDRGIAELEGQGGNDIYLVDPGSTVTIRDPGGNDVICLRDVGDIQLSDLTVSVDTENAMFIMEHSATDTVVKLCIFRSESGKITLKLLNNYAEKQTTLSSNLGLYLSSILQNPVLMTVSDADPTPSMRSVVFHGLSSISVYNAGGSLLGTFNNSTEGRYYTSFGYFYCDNSTDNGQKITAYLFDNACSITSFSESSESTVTLMHYAEGDSILTEAESAVSASSQEIRVQLEDSDAYNAGIYLGGIPAEVETIVFLQDLDLNHKELFLTTGETAQLQTITNPADANYPTVSWLSSDESVVTVDTSGKITAIGSGTATIYATADPYCAFCSVTVTAAQGASNITVSAVSTEYGVANIQLTNTSDDEKSCHLCVAAYNGSNRMLVSYMGNYTISAETQIPVSVDFSATDNIKTIKVFLLNADMTPITDAIPLSMQT